MTDSHDSLAKQRELYGEPLAVIAGRITGALGLTQGRLAEVLGLSAPMLSQLLSGHRVKIGNPLVVARLRGLTELAEQAPRLDSATIAARLTEIQDSAETITDARPREVLIDALRAAAPEVELTRLAGLTTAPALAALLRAAGRDH